MTRAPSPVSLCRHPGGERRRQLFPLSPWLPSTSSIPPFGRLQTGRNPRVGSPDLGVRAPSLPLPTCDTSGAGRMYRSAPLSGAAVA